MAVDYKITQLGAAGSFEVGDLLEIVQGGVNLKLSGTVLVDSLAASIQTLTNKTFDANGVGNSISNLETADFAVNVIDIDTSLTANSNTRLVSQKAIKTYHDFHLGTSLSKGGEISINVDTTKFDVEAGSGIFVNTYTDQENPTVLPLSWGKQEAIVITNIASASATFLGINSSGTIIQQTAPIGSEDERDIIPLGIISHINKTIADDICSTTNYNKDILLYTTDIITALGSRVKESGNLISANGANLKINRSAGTFFGNGINYGNSKKTPNRVNNSSQESLTFNLVKRTAGLSVFTEETDIPVTQYDPNGDGTLIDMSTDHFVAHRVYVEPCLNKVFVQYGQFEYDSFKKAVDSSEKEVYAQAVDITGVPTVAIIVVKQGTTSLNDLSENKFINLGRFGSFALNSVVNYSRFSDMIKTGNGISNERQELTFVDSGGVMYVDVEKENATADDHDIKYNFGEREYTLDCTNGSGVDGKARIALVHGTDEAPQENWVYVIRSGDEAILQSSTTDPGDEYAMVMTAFVPSVATSISKSFVNSRRHSDCKEVEGRGVMPTLLEKVRDPRPIRSGVGGTIIIDTGPSPDSVDFTVDAGVIREIYDQDVAALQLSVDGAVVINDPVTSYKPITDVNTIDVDSTGVSLNNKYFQLVFGISLNADGHSDRLTVNLPNGSYISASEAIKDVDKTANTTFPDGLKSVYLIAAGVFRLVGGTTWTLIDTINLRNKQQGTESTGGGSISIAHNDTTGKQGGTTDEYYHLDSADYAAISANTQLAQLGTGGTPTFASLLVVNDGNIGIVSDPDLLQLKNTELVINGQVLLGGEVLRGLNPIQISKEDNDTTGIVKVGGFYHITSTDTPIDGSGAYFAIHGFDSGFNTVEGAGFYTKFTDITASTVDSELAIKILINNTPTEITNITGTGFDVTGNITLSGTVDGIDIATDVSANTAHSGSDGKNHSDVVLNNTHRDSDGSSHSLLGQDVSPSANPVFVSQELGVGGLNMGAYWDTPDWKSSDAGSNFQIIQTSNELLFNFDEGVVVDNTITWNEGIVLDRFGRVTKPNQPYFAAYLGSDQSNVTGDATTYTVIHDQIDENIGSHYNNTTGKYTAPIDGKHLFTASSRIFGMGSSHDRAFISINIRNAGGTILRNYIGTELNPYAVREGVSGAEAVVLSVSKFIYMSASETADASITVSGSTKVIDVDSARVFTSFQGGLIC